MPDDRCIVDGCEQPQRPGSEFCATHRLRDDPRSNPATYAHMGPTGDDAIVCPHCHRAGHVTTRRVRQKKGVSGGKLTGAVLTSGISILGTGLSRKENGTEMHCHNCETTWVV